jgi:cytochrome P450
VKALSEANLLLDRYRVYEEHRPCARRIDRDELWFFEPSDCRSLLESPDLSSRRTGLAVRAESAGFPLVGEFFRQWLMYTDGDEHLKRRSAVVRGLKEILTEASIQPPQMELGSTFELVEDFCDPIVWSILPQLLGLAAEEGEFWRPRVEQLVGLPGTEESDVQALEKADLALRELHEFLKTHPCRLLSILATTLGQSAQSVTLANLAINVVGDGIHPTSAALATEVFLQLSQNRNTGMTSGFHADPPFQFAARVADCATAIRGFPIEAGQRVVACLAAANRNSNVKKNELPLTFGYGRHACVGRAHAERCIELGLGLFGKLTAGRARLDGEPRWIKSIGYRMIESLNIELSAA